jgi:heptosyltransferase-2
VLAPGWLGDTVMATPFLSALRERMPHARITVLARESAAELLRRSASVDAVVAHGRGRWARLAAARREGARGRIDVCFVLPPSFSAALASAASRARRRIGYGGACRRLLLSDALPTEGYRTEHLSRAYLRLLERLTGREEAVVPAPRVVPSDEWRERAAGLAGASAYFVLAPGATYGSAKVWPEARYAELAALLARRTGLVAVIVGGAGERGGAEALRAGIGAGARNLAGELSVADLVSVLAGARLVVGNDSGPAHIAAALGVPTVAVFGPTSVDWTAPRGAAVRIVRGRIECAPCFERRCPRGDRACLVTVEAREVFEAAVSLIEEA